MISQLTGHAFANRQAVIIFHAGGFVVGSSSMVPKPQIEELLDLGFVVIIPEYRLCPQVSVYEGPLSDAKACLAWVRKDMKAMIKAKADVEIDPQRVAVIGHSAGGNLALHMVRYDRDLSCVLIGLTRC